MSSVHRLLANEGSEGPFRQLPTAAGVGVEMRSFRGWGHGLAFLEMHCSEHGTKKLLSEYFFEPTSQNHQNKVIMKSA